MSENLKQNEGIESGRDAEEPETKRRDRIRARCWRTQNKTKGSNQSTMPENPKQKEGVESGRDAGEPKTKEGIERVHRRKERAMPSIRHQYHVRNPPLHIKLKSQSLKYYKHSFLRKIPPH